jgi:hypothetical protein
MSIQSRKAGTTFGTVNPAAGAAKQGTPEYFAQLIVKAAKELNMTPTVKLVSEGLGTIDAEGGFDGSLWNSNPAHPGPWGLGSSYGSYAERTDPYKSTYLAIRDRKENGSYQNSWWQWEEKQGEIETGKVRAKKFVKIAEAAGAGGSNPSFGEEIPLVGGLIGTAEGAVSEVESAEEFLQQLAETLLDFRALGNLMAQAAAWFLKLIAKAIWDYVIAPVIHWSERAVSFYWVNFFGTGTETGSGFGYQLRNNAGAITILFWSMGYAILWTDGSSASPVASHESLFGQGVKNVEGAIARRNLVKPKDVKEKTPSKPTPKVSATPIEMRGTYSVARKRPVTVHSEGRQRVSNQKLKARPVPRPTQQGPEQKQAQRLVLPSGVERGQAQTPHKRTAKPGRPRVGT